MGSGVDSSPYYRIFAPVGRSEKFDAAGYIRRSVPELGALPDARIHAPWESGPLPAGYPLPIVDHRRAQWGSACSLCGHHVRRIAMWADGHCVEDMKKGLRQRRRPLFSCGHAQLLSVAILPRRRAA